MMNTTTGSGLIMQWTEVPDPRGGSRLEARWVVQDAVAAATTPAALAALAAHAA